jgi:DNA-binding CsgD family transcriptional regulator
VLSTPKLVGRATEIAELDEEYRAAAAGAFRVALVVGDPGMGKTRLAREFLARKRDRATGLSGRGHALGSMASFGIWCEALERHLRELRQEEVRALCDGFTDDLATLLRTVAAVRGLPTEQQPSRPRLLGGLAVLLSNLAKARPVVLLLDDAHDADPSSWEALGYLARDISDARLLAIVTVRPFDLSENPVATDVLRRLDQDGLLRRLELKGLDSGMIGDLAQAVLGDRTLSSALLEWLKARSRGNPLFALGLLEALVDAGTDLSAPALRSVPEPLAARVLALLAKLDPPAVAVLETLSTFGRRVELRDLAPVTELPPDRLAGILERLVRSHLVLEDERGRDLVYEITHPLVQDAIYQRIGGARRRGVHRTLARALLASGRLGEAAPHFARSADVGDNEAIEALRDAVHQAEAVEAYREALTILNVLVELIPPSDNRWLRVLEALSRQAEWVVDHRADTHAVLGIRAMRAIDRLLDHSPDPAPRAVIRFRLASFLGWGSGDLAEAEQACRDAFSLFEQAGDRAGALLARNELSWMCGLRGDYRAMEEAAGVVVVDAAAAGEQLATIQALQTQAFAAAFRGRFHEAEAVVRRSNAIARAGDHIYRLTVGLTNLGIVLAAQGRSGQAVDALDEGKAVNPEWRHSILPEWEIIAHWFAGDFGAALACADEATARAGGDLSKRRALGVLFAALAAVEAGRSHQARRYLDGARRAFGGRDWQFFSHYCGYVQGVLDWQEGRFSDACARLSETARRVLDTGAQPYGALVLVDLAEVAAENGDARLAAEAAQQLQTIAATVDSDLYGALAAMASAWTDLTADARDRGASAALDATERLAATDCRVFHARACDLLGRSLLATNRPAAVEALRRAVATFEICGAVWRRDRARSVLRSLGPSGRRAAVAGLGPAALSRRERQIAHLAAQALMASEIADRLSISERTVETHLANVYTKLGVRSKVELIRRADEFMLNQ